MIEIAKIITPERVKCKHGISSKKRVLEVLSELITQDAPALPQAEAFESLIGRERLGSTGLGHGVAIPHGRLKALTWPVGAFLSLQEGVDYDAPDGKPVTLICALLVPEQATHDHLKLLAMLAEMFSNEEWCERLRAARSSSELHGLLAHWRPVDTEHLARPCA